MKKRNREANILRLRRLRAENPDWNREKNRKHQEKYPEKRTAHKAVEYALKTGRLVRRPCERCETTKLVHAHHDDYSRPLDVMWLCPLHHRERHRELNAAAVHVASSQNCAARVVLNGPGTRGDFLGVRP